MEHDIRAALIAWLASGPAPLDTLNAIEEEVPQRSGPPWLAIAASASADWGTKDRMGREVRVALELHTRGQDVAGDAALVRAIDRRVEDRASMTIFTSSPSSSCAPALNGARRVAARCCLNTVSAHSQTNRSKRP